MTSLIFIVAILWLTLLIALGIYSSCDYKEDKLKRFIGLFFDVAKLIFPIGFGMLVIFILIMILCS